MAAPAAEQRAPGRARSKFGSAGTRVVVEPSVLRGSHEYTAVSSRGGSTEMIGGAGEEDV